MVLQVGMEAPQFVLPDADMQDFDSSAYLGKKILCYIFILKTTRPAVLWKLMNLPSWMINLHSWIPS